MELENVRRNLAEERERRKLLLSGVDDFGSSMEAATERLSRRAEARARRDKEERAERVQGVQSSIDALLAGRLRGGIAPAATVPDVAQRTTSPPDSTTLWIEEDTQEASTSATPDISHTELRLRTMRYLKAKGGIPVRRGSVTPQDAVVHTKQSHAKGTKGASPALGGRGDGDGGGDGVVPQGGGDAMRAGAAQPGGGSPASSSSLGTVPSPPLRRGRSEERVGEVGMRMSPAGVHVAREETPQRTATPPRRMSSVSSEGVQRGVHAWKAPRRKASVSQGSQNGTPGSAVRGDPGDAAWSPGVEGVHTGRKGSVEGEDGMHTAPRAAPSVEGVRGATSEVRGAQGVRRRTATPPHRSASVSKAGSGVHGAPKGAVQVSAFGRTIAQSGSQGTSSSSSPTYQRGVKAGQPFRSRTPTSPAGAARVASVSPAQANSASSTNSANAVNPKKIVSKRVPVKVSTPTAEELERGARARQYISKQAVAGETAQEKRVGALLGQAKARVDEFCQREGIDPGRREDAPLILANRRAAKYKREKEQRAKAEQLKQQYLQQHREAKREQYLAGVEMRLAQRREAQRQVSTASLGRQGVQVPRGDRQHYTVVSRAQQPQTAPHRVHIAGGGGGGDVNPSDTTYDDVDRITINLFDTTLLSEPPSNSDMTPHQSFP